MAVKGKDRDYLQLFRRRIKHVTDRRRHLAAPVLRSADSVTDLRYLWIIAG